MPKRSKPRSTGRGRLSWDGRLLNRSGVEFEKSVAELTRKAAEDLVHDPAVEVAISIGGAPLRWVSPRDRNAAWRSDIGPNFHDQPGWKPPPFARGQLPFHAELWSGDGKRVVLVTDRD
jgi:hypothetical protein